MKYIVYFFMLGSAFANVDTLWIDNVNSKVEWIGRKVSGEHNGYINLAGGFIVHNKGKMINGEVLMNMQSITVEDIQDAKWNQKLVDHLKNDDFFNCEKFPTAKFIIESFKGKGMDTQISGQMTIRDKTVPMKFIINTVINADSSYANGRINIDRTLFDIKYGSGKFFENLGDRMILDDFTLNFNLIVR